MPRVRANFAQNSRECLTELLAVKIESKYEFAAASRKGKGAQDAQ
jgi:hypothetical protein